jgi:hypothetical protein
MVLPCFQALCNLWHKPTGTYQERKMLQFWRKLWQYVKQNIREAIVVIGKGRLNDDLLNVADAVVCTQRIENSRHNR